MAREFHDVILRDTAGRLERGSAGEAEEAARVLLGRLDRLQTELDRLLTGLRASAERLSDERDAR